MKYLLLSLLIPMFAHADYIPGRVRIIADGDMEVKQATGIFGEVKEVKISENYQDDAGIVSFFVNIGGSDMVFRVTGKGKSHCGHYLKSEYTSDKAQVFQMTLHDDADDLCRGPAPRTWRAELKFNSFGRDSLESNLEVVGIPEFRMITM